MGWELGSDFGPDGMGRAVVDWRPEHQLGHHRFKAVPPVLLERAIKKAHQVQVGELRGL